MKDGQESHLRAENAELRTRLAEAQETLSALRNGYVDALVVDNQVYMLTSAESASNQLRGKALGQVSDSIITVDNDFRVTWLNAAAERQYETSVSKALGRPLRDLYESSWLRPHDEAQAQQALRENGYWRGEQINRTRAGVELHVETAVSVLRDEQSTATGFLIGLRDISDRKRAEQALREYADRLKEADRRKDEFLATLAHELRNPLAPIRNAIELLKKANLDSDTFQFARTVAENQVEQMVRLIDDLMDVSRISRGKIELKKERVALRSIVEQALETSRPHIETAGHELSVALPSEAVYLNADPVRLAQVLANLINNACKYSEPGGRIDIRGETRAGEIANGEDGADSEDPNLQTEVVLSVKDTGIGIDPQHLPHIFELFSQVGPALERSQGGLGIGLSLARGIIELHGGSIEAHSGGVGMGSEIVVRLPGVIKALEQSEPANDTNLSSSALERLPILVVDDNRAQAQTLATLLDVTGYQARAAFDGNSALALLDEFMPRVALIDIGLPGMNGYELAQRIRQTVHGKDLTLIAQTGWGRDEDRERSRLAGFDYHLTKPIDLRLLERIFAGLDSAGAL